jgi:pimeloyl-ACP methyl ester carboxylesterase
MGGEEEFYIEYFQEPGRAEAEIEPDVRGWLTGFYLSASGDAPPLDPSTRATMATIPRGGRMRDRFAQPGPDGLPKWLPQDDLDVYVTEFEYTGFSGGLNRYRNVQRDWEDLAAFAWQPIPVPALFVGGSKDGPTLWGACAIDRFSQTLPKLYKSVILDGCGHWTQQERPDEVNRELVEFLQALDAR